MTQFYAQLQDQQLVRTAVVTRTPIRITGFALDGQLKAFTGTVQSVETGHTEHPGYPIRVTMFDGATVG